MNKFILPTILVSLTLSPGSWAKHHSHEKANWAKVTHVEPITRTIEHRIPQQQCWNDQVRYQGGTEGRSYTGTILGGIIGGAIGNKVGHNKSNKKIGSVVGAVLGASVGYDISNRGYADSGSGVSYHSERHCQVRDEIRYEEQVVGYRVWYRYRGDEYQTRMNYHPGKKIKVQVNVDPY